MFLGGEYTIWLNHMLMGFKPCMGIETYVKAIVSNYNKVGFGFDIENQLVPLMHLGLRGSPKLGLAHDGLVISFWLFGVWSWLCTADMDVTSRGIKGKCH